MGRVDNGSKGRDSVSRPDTHQTCSTSLSAEHHSLFLMTKHTLLTSAFSICHRLDDSKCHWKKGMFTKKSVIPTAVAVLNAGF